jgi:hypothetical protein
MGGFFSGDSKDKFPIYVSVLNAPPIKTADGKELPTISVHSFEHGHICNTRSQTIQSCGSNLDCILKMAVSTFGLATDKNHPFGNGNTKALGRNGMFETEFSCKQTKQTFLVKGVGIYMPPQSFNRWKTENNYVREGDIPMEVAPMAALFDREVYVQTTTATGSGWLAMFRVYVPYDRGGPHERRGLRGGGDRSVPTVIDAAYRERYPDGQRWKDTRRSSVAPAR